MYDKVHSTPGSVLRVEMTMNNEKSFRVYRSNEGEPEGEKKWRRMRRGLADLHRRAEVSQKVNERYLDALASVDDSARLQEILEPLEKRKQWKGHPVRALHPFSPEDGTMLEIISRAEFMIRGICNKDLRDRLFPSPAANPTEAKRRSALISRKLRLLRAHGIIHKIKGRNQYQVSTTGRAILTTFLIARQASANQLMKKAA
jgi:phenylpropionate dioxygenase-like ring-hydroxylating dioxygenase large terminal subunit